MYNVYKQEELAFCKPERKMIGAAEDGTIVATADDKKEGGGWKEGLVDKR